VSKSKGPNANNDMFPLKPGKPGKNADPTSDFARALEEANNAEGTAPDSVGLPAIFPGSREEIEDKPDLEELGEKVLEEVGLPKEKGMPSMIQSGAKDFVARYKRFDIGDPVDVAELEKINNHIMQDGWLPGREEWIHTRDGGTYVVLKWLERTTPLKKKDEGEDDTDAALKTFGIGRG